MNKEEYKELYNKYKEVKERVYRLGKLWCKGGEDIKLEDELVKELKENISYATNDILTEMQIDSNFEGEKEFEQEINKRQAVL